MIAFHVPAFVPAIGLGSPHAQTLFAHVFRPRERPVMTRERWALDDGDQLVVDRLAAPAHAPHLFLLHGLEGSSESSYVATVLRGAAARGWGALALNFRSCVEDNRLLRSYHAGDTGDALAALTRLLQSVHGPLFGVGFSLGAGVLLKLLAETGTRAPLAGAACISTPFDLDGCALAIDGHHAAGAADSALVGLYRWRFLLRLKRKAVGKALRHAGPYQLVRTLAATSLRGFDDAWTAPVHGYADAAAYYADSSAGPRIATIARPTLLISADDDPMVPGHLFPAAEVARNPLVTALRSPRGGHVGFVSGTPSRPRFWAEEAALAFLDAALAQPARAQVL